jgi:hypothetical protein
MPALGLVAALLVAVPFLKPWEILGMGPPSERVKGAVASLEVFADRDGRSLPLAPGASVLPGDRLQIRFDPGPYPFATFAGRDATGEVEIYRSLAVQGSGFRAAPFALELDDTPGDQELFAIFSREAPTAASVRDLLEGILSLRDAVVASIHLRKEDAP